MSTTSQNGWPVVEAVACTDLVVNGVHFPNGVLKGDVAVVFRWLAEQYHNRVERLVPGWCWGYDKKRIEGNPHVWSNHASGTAIDLNAPVHPQGVRATHAGLTPTQIAECQLLVEESAGAIRWGGDFTRPDVMHWETTGSPSAVRALANKIRDGVDMDPADVWAVTWGRGDRTETAGDKLVHVDTTVDELAVKLDAVRRALDEVLRRLPAA